MSRISWHTQVIFEVSIHIRDSVSASSTGYIVAITPGVYIQCMPVQEPALLTFCEGVVTSSTGDFVAEWALTTWSSRVSWAPSNTLRA